MHVGFWLGNLRERDNFKIPRRKWEDNIKLYEKLGMDQIDLTQDRDRWPAPAKAEINYRASYYAVKLLTS